MSTLKRILQLKERLEKKEKLDKKEADELWRLLEEARQLHALLRDSGLETNLSHVIQVMQKIHDSVASGLPIKPTVRDNLISSLRVNSDNFLHAASLLRTIAGTEHRAARVERREERLFKERKFAPDANFWAQQTFTKYKPPRFKI